MSPHFDSAHQIYIILLHLSLSYPFFFNRPQIRRCSIRRSLLRNFILVLLFSFHTQFSLHPTFSCVHSHGIHTPHLSGQLRASYLCPPYPSRNVMVIESLRYETSLNILKGFLIPRYSLTHVKQLSHKNSFQFLCTFIYVCIFIYVYSIF